MAIHRMVDSLHRNDDEKKSFREKSWKLFITYIVILRIFFDM
jgi:hypothetical protein